MGPERLLIEAVRMGADGGVAGGANVFPELFVNGYRAAKENDNAAMKELQERIDLFQRMYDIGKYASRHIKAVKSALSILGVCSDFLAEPFHKFKAPERARVAAILDELERTKPPPTPKTK
jgi:4-hydroxy-tetrahydrodipicolinate synthase